VIDLMMLRLVRLLALALSAGLAGEAAFAQAASAPPLDSIAERTRACTFCHGKEGRATSEGYFPRIAGKPAGYLYNQLINFRDGRRSNVAMIYLVQHMSDAYLQEIGQYFGALDLPYPLPQRATVAPAALARGETLVLHGDASRKIPACVQCHGDKLTGVAPSMPGLLGLPHDYIIGQFGAWGSGQRKAAPPDCMAQITKRLAPDDISALAAWLAARPVPVDTHPAPTIALPLPIDCGSGLK